MICMQVTNVQLFNHRHENVNDVNETRSQSVIQSVMYALPSIKVLEVGRCQQPTNQPTQTPNSCFFVLFPILLKLFHGQTLLIIAIIPVDTLQPLASVVVHTNQKTNSHHAIRKEEREPTCQVCR